MFRRLLRHSLLYVLGGWNAADKSPSVWDTFAHTEGKIRDQSTGDIACDSYNNINKDIEMIKVGFFLMKVCYLSIGSVADMIKRYCYDDTDCMIWVQPAPWSRCCILG